MASSPGITASITATSGTSLVIASNIVMPSFGRVITKNPLVRKAAAQFTPYCAESSPIKILILSFIILSSA